MLQAAAFFQDVAIVEPLCGILGARLLDAACSEQSTCSKTELVTSVRALCFAWLSHSGAYCQSVFDR